MPPGNSLEGSFQILLSCSQSFGGPPIALRVKSKSLSQETPHSPLNLQTLCSRLGSFFFFKTFFFVVVGCGPFLKSFLNLLQYCFCSMVSFLWP